MKPGYLVTNKDTFLVFKDDWKETVAQVQTGSVQSVEKDEENQCMVANRPIICSLCLLG